MIENTGDIQALYAPLVIDPIFGSSIRSLTGTGSDPTTAAEIENAVSAAVNFYDTNFTSSVPAVINDGTVSNTVTVTIQFDYGTVDGNTMASGGGASESESSGPVYLTYGQLRSALAGALPNLPAADPTGGAGFLVPDAQAEVLGLPGISPGVDGYVGLNTIANGVTMDYNLANQSITGEIGVLGALEHEIAEDFGRIAIDGTESEQQSIGPSITTTPLYSILDLFRFSAPGKPALTPGPSDYFSLDNGMTDLGAFNDISNGGDAGDWASSVVADAFDAFITTGTAGTISTLDKMVLSTIGLLPAPGTGTTTSPPAIAGIAAAQTVTDQTTIAPFSGVTITDPGAGETDTVTVSLSVAANGTLSNLDGGTYSAATGTYTVSGTASSVTTALDGLVFTPTAHQAAAGQTVTTGFTISVTDTSGVSVTDDKTSVVTTETAVSAAVVDAAYVAILRTQPGTALLDATVTQIASGQLTLAQFETSLITAEQALYTTLPALVTIDAFYGATPASALLTTAAAATGGTSYDTAQELHDLGYSDPNVWTVLGAGWGADHGSGFFAQYSADATGTASGYTAFLDAAYQQEFGFQPGAANLQSLLADVPGLTALLSGGGNTATPIQVMGGLYGYLLYAGQSNGIGRYAASADAFLAAAANGTVTYGPELTLEFPAASAGVGTSITTGISSDQLIDPGAGIQFLPADAPRRGSDGLDIGSLLTGTGVDWRGDVAAFGGYPIIPGPGSGGFLGFDPTERGGGDVVSVSRGLRGTVVTPDTLMHGSEPLHTLR